MDKLIVAGVIFGVVWMGWLLWTAIRGVDAVRELKKGKK